ncbi:MAG TPA: response regulator transcription factor [Ignavibacteriaceae bacterium]|jgi:DNA-binding NarL/FixJ family response regulator|nr:response regulator transcription factor [Ignavibacteriaceae bacterium]
MTQLRHNIYPQGLLSLVMTKNENIIVWIIEDNEYFRSTIEDLLNSTERFDCTAGFSNCEDAIDALSKESPPDVILLDIGLPGMSGVEGIQHIKSISPNTAVIIQTVHDDNENVFNSLTAGASGYILKTSSKEKIIESIDEVMQGGAPMNGQIAKKVLDVFKNLSAPVKEYQLTERETEVLHSLVEGKTKRQIADVLYLSYHTVDNHIRNIYSKLHVHSRTAAVAKAVKEKL